MLNDDNLCKIGRAYAACKKVLGGRENHVPPQHVDHPIMGLTTVFKLVTQERKLTDEIDQLMEEALVGIDPNDTRAGLPPVRLGSWWVGYYKYKHDSGLTFGEKIKVARTNKKLSQKECAEFLDVPYDTFQKWEMGKTEPNKITMSAVLAVLE